MPHSVNSTPDVIRIIAQTQQTFVEILTYTINKILREHTKLDNIIEHHTFSTRPDDERDAILLKREHMVHLYCMFESMRRQVNRIVDESIRQLHEFEAER